MKTKRFSVEAGSYYRTGNGKNVQVLDVNSDDVWYLVISAKRRMGKNLHVGEVYKCKYLSFVGNYRSKLGFEIRIDDIWK